MNNVDMENIDDVLLNDDYKLFVCQMMDFCSKQINRKFSTKSLFNKIRTFLQNNYMGMEIYLSAHIRDLKNVEITDENVKVLIQSTIKYLEFLQTIYILGGRK